jgi:hypothetical protein
MFNKIYTIHETDSQNQNTLQLPNFENTYNSNWTNIKPLKRELNSKVRAEQRYNAQIANIAMHNNNTPREPDLSISKIATDRANYSSGNY